MVMFAVMPVILGSCGSNSDEEQTGLIVRHMPDPVPAVRAIDDENGTTSYRWIFRTEVINTTSVPLKIIDFAFYSRLNGEWVNSNQDGNVYSNEEFANWYDSGDSLRNGWILPGETAADSNNWVTNILPVQRRSMWRYNAVDSMGNKFRGEAEVYLLPFYEDKEYWPDIDPASLVLIKGKVSTPSGAPPSYAQVRITPFSGTHRKAYEVGLIDDEGRFEVHVAASGLYKIFIYSPGFEPVTRTLAFADHEREIPFHLLMKSAGNPPEIVLDDSSDHLRRIWEMERDISHERELSAAAYKEYSRTHKDSRGFRYDWSKPESVLTDIAKHDPDGTVRKFSALMLADIMRYSGSIHDATNIEWLLDILPPDSPYWGGMPQLPTWIFFVNDEYIEMYLTQFAEKNPDRTVRAYAILTLSIYFKGKGDDNRSVDYYDLACSEYSDIKGLEYLFEKADPDMVSRIREGVDLPEFEVTTIDDKRSISRKDLEGKYWLIHFWATWCGPCKKDMKYLHEAFEKFKDREFYILSISVDSDPKKVIEFRKELWPMPWYNAVEVKGTQSKIGYEFEVRGVPKMILVDPEGRIVEVGMQLRGDKLVSFLEKCINKEKE